MPRKKYSPSAEVKESLRQSGLRARKKLGQHFLTDESVVETIISAAELSPDDFVIEIGPGLGILTAALVQRAGHVTAVELDDKLASQLKQTLASSPNVTIINADILEVDLLDVTGGKPFKVVANIPYYITSPILHYFVEAPLKPSLMVVMVQKEVGDAIVAEPGKMTMLAVSMQLYSRPRLIAYVSSQSFYPPPKVDSAIVRFDVLPEPAVKVTNIKGFLDFVKCGFRSPRKQLRNSLAQGLNRKPADISSLLTEAAIDSHRRPETLSLGEWQRLYEVAISPGKAALPC